MRERLLDGACRFLGVALVLAAALWGAEPARSAEVKVTDPPAVLRALNRDVITMRASVAGVGPEERVRRAEERLRAVRPRDVIDAPLHAEPLQFANVRGAQIMLGDQLLFGVLEGDVDPTIDQSHEALVKQTLANLEEVRRVWLETRRPGLCSTPCCGPRSRARSSPRSSMGSAAPSAAASAGSSASGTQSPRSMQARRSGSSCSAFSCASR